MWSLGQKPIFRGQHSVGMGPTRAVLWMEHTIARRKTKTILRYVLKLSHILGQLMGAEL